MTVRKQGLASDHLLFAAALALVAGACSAHDAPIPTPSPMPRVSASAVYAADPPKVGGAEAKVSLLARAFLPPTNEALPGFAYYAYLVFIDRSPTDAAARRAASAMYLGMLTHVHVTSPESGIRREDMAVLYVPLADPTAVRSLMAFRDPQSLLVAYNYDRAGQLAARIRQAGKTVPDVAIIGSPVPLAADAPIDSGAIDIVDLTDPGTVEERMERFRNTLEAGELHLTDEGRPVVLDRLRGFFAWANTAGQEGSPATLTF